MTGIQARSHRESGEVSIALPRVMRFLAALGVSTLLWSGTLLLSDLVLQSLPPFISWFGGLDHLSALGLALLVLSLTGILSLGIWRLARLWWRRTYFGFTDGALSLLLALDAVGLFAHTTRHRRLSLKAELVVLLLLFLFRGLVYRRSVETRGKTVEETSLFDRLLGAGGFEPLKTFSNDELQRRPLLEALLELVRPSRDASIAFGLEGPWGSGKTSLLNGLREELSKENYVIVEFSTWDYREPSHLVMGYLEKLSRTLQRQGMAASSTVFLRRLARGLLAASGSRLSSGLVPFTKNFLEETVEKSRNELSRSLRALGKPIVVLVDDLDRLDRDELVAVLRLVRLVGDLPNVTHVVALDRRQVATTLFPDDPDGTRARDYIAKVLPVEISLGSTPHELLVPMLEAGLRALIGTLPESARETFLERIRSSLSDLTAALPTPREVRRVVASCGWVWERMSEHLNLFDLLVLSIIHYRAPSAYDSLEYRPEWFAETKWSQDPRRILYGEEWSEQGEKYLEAFERSDDRSDIIISHLLAAILPHLTTQHPLGHGSPDEETARKERRLAHPAIYNRYFHLYIPPQTVSEAEIEEFAKWVGELTPGRSRQQEIVARLRKEIEADRIDSFLEQWYLVYPLRPLSQVRLPPDVIEDLSLALAEASPELPFEDSFLTTSPRRAAAFKIHFLSYGLSSDQAVTDLLTKVIERAANLPFCGDLLEFADPAAREAADRDKPTADLEQLRRVLTEKIALRLVDGERLLREDPVYPTQVLSIALFRTMDDPRIRERILFELEEDPQFLPQLLSVVARVRTSPQPRRVKPETAKFEELRPRLDLENVQQLTRNLPLDTWSTNWEREIVSRFREFMTQSKDPSARS